MYLSGHDALETTQIFSANNVIPIVGRVLFRWVEEQCSDDRKSTIPIIGKRNQVLFL